MLNSTWEVFTGAHSCVGSVIRNLSCLNWVHSTVDGVQEACTPLEQSSSSWEGLRGLSFPWNASWFWVSRSSFFSHAASMFHVFSFLFVPIGFWPHCKSLPVFTWASAATRDLLSSVSFRDSSFSSLVPPFSLTPDVSLAQSLDSLERRGC